MPQGSVWGPNLYLHAFWRSFVSIESTNCKTRFWFYFARKCWDLKLILFLLLSSIPDKSVIKLTLPFVNKYLVRYFYYVLFDKSIHIFTCIIPLKIMGNVNNNFTKRFFYLHHLRCKAANLTASKDVQSLVLKRLLSKLRSITWTKGPNHPFTPLHKLPCLKPLWKSWHYQLLSWPIEIGPQ